MRAGTAYDAVVIGAGPNGLAAAVTLARAGRSVVVYEARETVGGGCRTAELTLPGFRHDVCSAIHPLALGSPFFRTVPFARLGVEWCEPPLPLAHPLGDGAAVLARSVEETAKSLGSDAGAYTRMMAPLVAGWEGTADAILGPLRVPRHPLALARFGLRAIQPAAWMARRMFRGAAARALFAGMSAHSFLRLEQPPSAAFGLVLGVLGHASGWPLPRGGSQAIADALAAYLKEMGGQIVTATPIDSLDQLPSSRAVLFDTSTRDLLRIAGERLPERYRRQLQRYRYGPGVCKVDYALDGPVPWRAADCARAGTVHVGGTLEEIAAAERAVWHGEHPERPFVLVAQQSLFDPTRAPTGMHTLWTYCHVPAGSTVDMSARIEAQIERFAPGFRDRILARCVCTAAQLERYDANAVGGDVNGGVADLWQLFTRPAPRLDPYRTPDPGIYLCSAATPPGGGVHGMCGYWAAHSALRRI